MYCNLQSSRTKIFICVSAIISSPTTVVPLIMVTPPTVAPITMLVCNSSPNPGRRYRRKFFTSPILQCLAVCKECVLH